MIIMEYLKFEGEYLNGKRLKKVKMLYIYK